MQTTQNTNGKFVRRIAVAGAAYFTAVVAVFAVVFGPAVAIPTMAPFWLMTMLFAVGTYAAGAWLGSRTPVEATTD